MNEEEFTVFAKAIKTYYPRENLLPTSESMELWFQALKDIEYKVASTALAKYISTNKFSPTIADIREYASNIVHDEIPDWGSAWQEVTRAISFFGMYREEEAVKSMSSLTQEAVRRLGFKNICLTENIVADRARFRDIYIALSARKKDQQQTSVNILESIEKIRVSTKQQDIEKIGGIGNARIGHKI